MHVMPPPTRRSVIRYSAVVAGLLAASGLLPRPAGAGPGPYAAAAFAADSLSDALAALGTGAPVESRDITVTAPDSVDSGADVALGVSTTLSGVTRLLLLVEHNPTPLVAVFRPSAALEVDFALRIKMDRSGDVYAVALLADGRTCFARQAVEVSRSACSS